MAVIIGIPILETISNEDQMRVLDWGLRHPHVVGINPLGGRQSDSPARPGNTIEVVDGILKFDVASPDERCTRYNGTVGSEEDLAREPFARVMELRVVRSNMSGSHNNVEQFRLHRMAGDLGILSIDRSFRLSRESGFHFTTPSLESFRKAVDEICSIWQ